MFIDSARFSVSSGKGGQGCASFRREKFVVQGGPDGGDGGKGGDVYFVVDSNTDTLSFYKGKRVFKADKGQPGMGRQKTGKSGEHLILTVPPGTQIIDDDTNEVLYDLLEDGEKFLFIEGGKGGLGNVHFKNSRNQRPTYFQPGLPGITKNIRLELKLIADVGLVGYPNVGKSTLISVTSNATPEIANYEFTTLTPKLGVVNVGDYSSFVMADIPGIIDGASEGIDVANHRTMIDQYKVLKEELFKFSQELSQRDFAIVLSKIDAYYGEDLQNDIQEFLKALNLETSKSNEYKFDTNLPYYVQDLIFTKKDSSKPYFVLPISSLDKTNINPLKYALYTMLGK